MKIAVASQQRLILRYPINSTILLQQDEENLDIYKYTNRPSYATLQ